LNSISVSLAGSDSAAIIGEKKATLSYAAVAADKRGP
jgi:hypothetical protein